MTDLMTTQTITDDGLPRGKRAVRRFLKENPGIVSEVLKALRRTTPTYDVMFLYRVLHRTKTSRRAAQAFQRAVARRQAQGGEKKSRAA